MQCPIHWSDFHGGSLWFLGKRAFWPFSGLIRSMAIDCLSVWLVSVAPPLKKMTEFDSIVKKGRK
jgi:hypothetical protein